MKLQKLVLATAPTGSMCLSLTSALLAHFAKHLQNLLLQLHQGSKFSLATLARFIKSNKKAPPSDAFSYNS